MLEFAGRRVVLDCGMHPKHEGEDALPDLRAIPDGELDAIIITHAHLDHIGSLPVLMRRQPRARVFMSPPTAQLGEALLHNSVNVMARPYGGSARPTGTVTPTPPGPPPGVAAVHAPRGRPVRATSGSRARLRQAWSFEGERLGAPRYRGGRELRVLRRRAHPRQRGRAHPRGGPTGVLHGRREFSRSDGQPRGRFPRWRRTKPIDTLIVETTRGDHPVPPGRTRADEDRRGWRGR